MADKQWMPPSPILGSVKMIRDILGPTIPIPPLAELMQYEDGEIMYHEDGTPMEYEHE